MESGRYERAFGKAKNQQAKPISIRVSASHDIHSTPPVMIFVISRTEAAKNERRAARSSLPDMGSMSFILEE